MARFAVPEHLRGIKVRVCSMADADHAKARRQYAHTIHIPRTICVARAFYALPNGHYVAIIAHEFGHLHCQEVFGPDHTEAQADAAAHALFGKPIEYIDSAHGRRLEHLSGVAVDRVAERLLKYDIEWSA